MRSVIGARQPANRGKKAEAASTRPIVDPPLRVPGKGSSHRGWIGISSPPSHGKARRVAARAPWARALPMESPAVADRDTSGTERLGNVPGASPPWRGAVGTVESHRHAD